ncbi:MULTISPECIES: 50S ribosomal protein L9 [Inquilinus]|jgi:large subunit ribosomal protein L9|uniref:Large ribosomal subunit protein bL9 n=1 Tax=Inquilinus ginsengisoli TaxID=363840 RepID=A0ABU1JW06_9PROT|nr:50S ribosomal protein L9 [Inquilinus ginsengisoli]MDR6292807.1 large subunit ribosomal protein L9 [Inquilinus ginsengisoli]
MEIILLERVEKLGQIGDVVKVKPGFARNYLLPQKKALRATKANLAVFEKQRVQIEANNLELKAEAEKVAGRMNDVQIVVIRQAGDSGQLYGSVSARDIAESLTTDGYSVDRSQVAIEHPIKTLGLEKVRLRLHPEVSVTVTVNVARSAEEAEMQRARGGMVSASLLEDEEEAAEAAAAAEAGRIATEAEDVDTEGEAA